MGIISPVLAAATVVNSKQMGLIERMAPPEDISVNGNLIDWLFAYTTGMNIFFFVLVCIGLFGFSWFYRAEDNPVQVEVLAQQWAWHFRYAGNDGIFNTEDDIVQLNDLRLPTDRKVVIQVLSKDVIHSLYFPNARRKVDAIPGRLTRMWWEPTKAGTWDIACAEMCGTYHYRMKASLTTYSQEDFAVWLAEAQEKALQENDPENPELFWGWKWQY